MSVRSGVYSWVNEERGHLGFRIEFSWDRIIFSGYSLPATKYSGGGQTEYLLTDYYVGSEIYNKVEECFSKELAEHLLKLVQDADNIPHVKEFNDETKLLEKWLSDKKEVDILSSIQSKLPCGKWYYPYHEDFNVLPINRVVDESQNTAKFYDKDYDVLLFEGHKNSQVQIQEEKGIWRAYLMGEQELVVLHEVLGEVLISKPLEGIKPIVGGARGSASRLLKAGGLLFVQFDRVRARSKYGSYLFSLDPNSGKIAYQKIN